MFGLDGKADDGKEWSYIYRTSQGVHIKRSIIFEEKLSLFEISIVIPWCSNVWKITVFVVLIFFSFWFPVAVLITKTTKCQNSENIKSCLHSELNFGNKKEFSKTNGSLLSMKELSCLWNYEYVIQCVITNHHMVWT
jgi:hypothetical protein